MKKILYTLGTLLLLASCIDYDDATKEITARVKLTMPAEFVNGSDLAGHTITMQQGSTLLTATTDADGIATFSSLIPDIYDISCSWEITGDEYHKFTGDQQAVSGCTVSGSLNNHLISEEQTIQLSTILSINRDIIIGKIY